ncbi:hypothetical protein FRX31_032548, partial [Thalictrum thalictroides]
AHLQQQISPHFTIRQRNTILPARFSKSAFSQVMGCSLRVLPCCYLGLLLGVTFTEKTLWTKLFQNKIAGWRKNYLSK